MRNCCMCGRLTCNSVVSSLTINKDKKFLFEPNIFCNKCLKYLKTQIYQHLGIETKRKQNIIISEIKSERLHNIDDNMEGEVVNNNIDNREYYDITSGINIDSDFDLETGEVLVRR